MIYMASQHEHKHTFNILCFSYCTNSTTALESYRALLAYVIIGSIAHIRLQMESTSLNRNEVNSVVKGL